MKSPGTPLGALVLAAVLTSFWCPQSAGAQAALQSLAGRWKMTATMSLQPPSADGAQRGQRAQALRDTIAARAARTGRTVRAARGAQAVQTDTAATSDYSSAMNGDQFLNVVVRGDTVIAVDSATATVRSDTFVVNGKDRPFTAPGRGAAAARPNRTAPATPGVRRATTAAQGKGFSVSDSLGLAVANRSIAIHTTTKWSLSEDGKTLTIESTTSGAQGGGTTIKRLFTKPEK